jgi:taurine dioxygenase
MIKGEHAMTIEDADDALTEASPIPGAPFGWQVHVDLSASPSKAVCDALVRIYKRDGLILFRNQSLNMDQQLDACEIFGPVLRGALDNYLVSNVVKGGLLGNAELQFHNDIPFVPVPYSGGSLHALEVATEGAPPTRFASAMRAWEQLPTSLQSRVETLSSLQVPGHNYARRMTLADVTPGDNCAVHAVVGRQEETDRPYLFINMWMTACFTTLATAESDALLEDLFAYLYAPDNVYEHHWTKGDLVIWDNLAIQHARSAFGAAPRTLQRVTIAKFGYWEQVPSDLPLYQALQEQ